MATLSMGVGHWTEPHRDADMLCHNCPKVGTAYTIEHQTLLLLRTTAMPFGVRQ